MNVYLYQNNTEKILKNIYIGEYGWEPWSNTKFYYPLTDDQLDKVWSTSIPITWTKQTIWYTFNFTWEYATALNNSNIWVWFISLWSKFNNYNTFSGGHYYSQWVSTNYAEIVYNYAHEGATASRTFQWRTGNTDWVLSSQQDSPTWSWFHMAYWFDWSKLYWYINWVKVREVTPGSTYTNSSISFGRLMNITYSEVIWESVVRTADEIQFYYNMTKKNYWIS